MLLEVLLAVRIRLLGDRHGSLCQAYAVLYDILSRSLASALTAPYYLLSPYEVIMIESADAVVGLIVDYCMRNGDLEDFHLILLIVLDVLIVA